MSIVPEVRASHAIKPSEKADGGGLILEGHKLISMEGSDGLTVEMLKVPPSIPFPAVVESPAASLGPLPSPSTPRAMEIPSTLAHDIISSNSTPLPAHSLSEAYTINTTNIVPDDGDAGSDLVFSDVNEHSEQQDDQL